MILCYLLFKSDWLEALWVQHDGWPKQGNVQVALRGFVRSAESKCSSKSRTMRISM